MLHRDLKSFEIFHGWRLMTLGAALGVVVLVAPVAWRLHASCAAALLSVLVLLSFSNFVECSFVVRNDSFAVNFVVAAFAVALLSRSPAPWPASPFSARRRRSTTRLLWAAGCLLVGFDAGRIRGAMTRWLRFSAGFAVPLVLYAFAFGGLGFQEVLRAMFVSPLTFAASLNHYSDGLGRFVMPTLTRNPAAYLVSAAGLGIALLRWREAPTRVRAAALATVIITMLLFVHQQPWPCVLVLAPPFLAIWAPLTVQRLSLPRRFWGLAALILLLSPSFVRKVQRLGDASASRFDQVREAEAQLAPGDRYFVATGRLPHEGPVLDLFVGIYDL